MLKAARVHSKQRSKLHAESLGVNLVSSSGSRVKAERYLVARKRQHEDQRMDSLKVQLFFFSNPK